MRRALIWFAAFCVAGVCIVMAIVLARPVMFPHQVAFEGYGLYADQPFEDAAAITWLARLKAEAEKSPLGPPTGTVNVFSAGTAINRSIYFAAIPKASALYYPALTPRAVYVRGMNVGEDQVIYNSVALKPPATLTYYALHEIAHMRTRNILGTTAYIRLPQWAREGVADYVALGPLTGAVADRYLALEEITMAHRRSDGSYPQARAMVTHFLEQKGWTFEQLLATSLGRAEARAQVLAARE